MTLYSRAETDAQSLKVLNTTVKDSVDKYDHDNTLIVDGDSTVQGAQGYTTAARRVVFIDEVEAILAENKERGLTAPGWWEYMTFTDASGRTRHKAQHLTSFKSAPANAADGDDDVAADVAANIALAADWAAASTAAPVLAIGNVITLSEATHNGVNIVVDANDIVDAGSSVLNGGTLSFQWQRQKTATGRWANVTDALDGGTFFTGMSAGAPVLTILGAQVLEDDGVDGYEFRVKITSSTGAEEVVSPDLAIVVGA
jgi:hypothetical protein